MEQARPPAPKPPTAPPSVQPPPPPRPPASGQSNKTLLYVIGGVVGATCFICVACCMCGPVMSIFIETDLERADKLWEEGKKDEAVEIYASEVEKTSFPNALALKRCAEHHFAQGNQQRAEHFIDIAVEKEVAISLDPDELRTTYAAAKAKFDREQEAAKERKVAEKEAERRSNIKADNSAAWAMAQSFVKDMLKSPSTADFGSAFGEYQAPDDCVRFLGDGEYQVQGWVDSQNAFGATVRTDFILKIRDNGDDTWNLIEEPVLITR